MEENLDINYEVNKKISDNNTNVNSQEIKEPRSEKDTNLDINNSNSQNKPTSKVGIKNENDIPIKPITKQKKRTPNREKTFPRIC